MHWTRCGPTAGTELLSRASPSIRRRLRASISPPAGFAPSTGQHDSDIRIIGVERYEANGEGYTYDKHRRLWTMNADGSGQHQVVRSERGSEDQFTWSPDDRTLAFTSPRREPPQANESDIYTMASEGGDARLPQEHAHLQRLARLPLRQSVGLSLR